MFIRIKNDINGNPRYVCHFFALVNDEEKELIRQKPGRYIENLYKLAVKKANTIGGRKYDTKNFGGGIVFQSYNVDTLENDIFDLKNTVFNYLIK